MSDLAFTRWGALWRSENELDGRTRHIICDHERPVLFITRDEARAWIREEYAWLKKRGDLRREPHGWRMPVPVRVEIRLADMRDAKRDGENAE